jgi:uncharacterized membrane protein
MGKLSGKRTVEIAAPLERVYGIAADLHRAPEWHASMKNVNVLETDHEGRATLVETTNDAKVKDVRSILRFAYPSATRVEWEQVKGDLKSLIGWWHFEDLGGRTRATYNLEGDPGRVLGMLLRGPVEEKVRDFLIGGAAEGLKAHAEAGA